MPEIVTPYTAWCEHHGVTHGHCPRACDKPQPANYAGDERVICGACYFHDGTISEVVPCVPETCRDA